MRLLAAPLLVALVVGCARRGEAVSPQPQAPEPSTTEPLPGGQPAPSGAIAPTSLDGDEGPALTTLEAAEAEFARVERQLDALWAPATETPETKASSDLALRCETACKAFLSLERSAAAICRLGGEADSRCTHARNTVERNRQRISECACS